MDFIRLCVVRAGFLMDGWGRPDGHGDEKPQVRDQKDGVRRTCSASSILELCPQSNFRVFLLFVLSSGGSSFEYFSDMKVEAFV